MVPPPSHLLHEYQTLGSSSGSSSGSSINISNIFKRYNQEHPYHEINAAFQNAFMKAGFGPDEFTPTDEQLKHISELNFDYDLYNNLARLNYDKLKTKKHTPIDNPNLKKMLYIYFGKLIDADNSRENDVYMKKDGWFVTDRKDWFNCTLIMENDKPKIEPKKNNLIHSHPQKFLFRKKTEWTWGGKKSKTKKSVKKTTTKKPTTKKPVKKTVTKKPTTKKPVKKTTTKKPTSKKPVKKTVTKKPTSKKPVKKTVTKKPTTKKPVKKTTKK